jgi:hypothetical protein
MDDGRTHEVDTSLIVTVPTITSTLFLAEPHLASIIRAEPGGHAFSLTFAQQEAGMAWGVVRPRGLVAPSREEVKHAAVTCATSENCVCAGGAIVINSTFREEVNMSFVDCNLRLGVSYDAFVYVEEHPAAFENAGTLSGPVRIKAPWFDHSPSVNGPVTMGGFAVELTPDTGGYVSLIVLDHHALANTTVPSCAAVKAMAARSASLASARDYPAMRGSLTRCAIDTVPIYKNVGGIYQLTRCHLEAGRAYPVYVCITDGLNEEVDATLVVGVPRTPTNAFLLQPAVSTQR